MSPLEKLMAEIVIAVPQIDRENLFDLVDQLVEDCGSIEEATEAIKSGAIGFNEGGRTFADPRR